MSEPTEPDVSEEHPISESWVWAGAHRPAIPRVLVEHMTSNWAEVEPEASVHPAAEHCARRRQQLSAAFPLTTLVIPSGTLKTRSNDTEYRFRPGTDFFWLTSSHEPDGVLVLHPEGDGHRAVLYLETGGDVSTHRFFTDAVYGELWTGPRRSLTAASSYLGIDTAPLGELEKDLVGIDAAAMGTVRNLAPSVDALREPSSVDGTLVQQLNELRLAKDPYEVAKLQEAVDATVLGFCDVVRALPEAIGRGERVIEGVFNLRARVEGNDVGYNTIAATGAHATILHWTRNDGVVRAGDLLLLDAGVECDDLYTADVTRTLPISGTFSPAQREIYELVLAAQEAGIAAVRPGAAFTAPHEAAMEVLTEGLIDLGILSGTKEEILRRDRQLHRRYTLHGTSHMLGLDVHDCSHARDEHYYRGELKEGFVLTVEPGLYFQERDLTVPERYRGIGVRIEDDVLVTPTGARVLSASLPRTVEAIEAWMGELWAEGTTNLGLGR